MCWHESVAKSQRWCYARFVRPRKRLEPRSNDRLAARIREQGRTIAWFCLQMGVSRWAFLRIENGEAGVPVDWYERAAAVLGVKAEDVAPEASMAGVAA